MIRIHPSALVESEEIGEGTCIWAMAHIMKGARIGASCNVGDHAFLESGAIVGNNVTIKNQVLIWEGITVEDDVFIGPRVTFTNDRYPRSPRMPQAKDRYSSRENWLERTIVRRGCSIGAGAILCPGLELGAYSVIGAGSVVTANVAPFAIVRGNPARQVADVCVCGHPQSGGWRTSDCANCGQTGYDRQQFFNPAKLAAPHIVSRRPVEQHG